MAGPIYMGAPTKALTMAERVEALADVALDLAHGTPAERDTCYKLASVVRVFASDSEAERYERLAKLGLELVTAGYQADVDDIARDLVDRLKAEGCRGEDAREWLLEAMQEDCDGSSWVIHDTDAQRLLMVSQNDSAAADEGAEIDHSGGIKWGALAFYALQADVRDALERMGVDVNDPSPEPEVSVEASNVSTSSETDGAVDVDVDVTVTTGDEEETYQGEVTLKRRQDTGEWDSWGGSPEFWVEGGLLAWLDKRLNADEFKAAMGEIAATAGAEASRVRP